MFYCLLLQGASSSSGDTFRQQPKMEEPMDTSPQVHRPDFQFDGEVVDCSSVEVDIVLFTIFLFSTADNSIFIIGSISFM